MLTPRTAWGLDIGESSIKAVKVRRTKAGAEILAFDMVDRAWPSDDTGDKDYQLRSALFALTQRQPLGRVPVAVSIPEPAFSRFIPLPPVDRRRIPEVVRYEARQQIPFPIEEVVWDYQPVREATEPGEETEVAIFSLRSQFVYALLQNLAVAKVRPSAVLPVPLALYNYLTFDRDIAKGTIVVDLGAGSTDILICDPENFRVRNITVSGNGITRALADRLKIGQAEAEKLKRECTDAVQATRLFKLIQPTLNDLVSQVQRTIGFFKSQIHNVRIEQALLLGNTFKLPGVSEFLASQLGCDLIPADNLERITLGPNVDSAALKSALPSLAVSLGLALQGVGLGRVQVNLIPRDYVMQQELNRKRPYVAAAVGCLGLLLGGHLLSVRAEKKAVDGNLAYVRGKAAEVANVDQLIKDYDAAQGEVRSAVDALKKEPADLSVGKSIGYRGCLQATNEICRVLFKDATPGSMSTDIVITRIDVAPLPSDGTFKAEDFGGTSGTRKLPAVRIKLSGLTRSTDPSFLEQQVVVRLERATMSTGTGSRRSFAVLRDTYMPVRLGTEDGFEFTLTCDFPITAPLGN